MAAENNKPSKIKITAIGIIDWASRLSAARKFVFAFMLMIAGLMSWNFLYFAAIPNIFHNSKNSTRISGSFPHSDGWKLMVQVVYASTNENCASTPKAFGIFEQTDRPISKKHFELYMAKPTGERDQYELIVPHDAVLGFCQWTPFSYKMILKDKHGEYVSLLDYGYSGAFPPENEGRFVCSSKLTGNFAKAKSFGHRIKEGYRCKNEIDGKQFDAYGLLENSLEYKSNLRIDFRVEE